MKKIILALSMVFVLSSCFGGDDLRATSQLSPSQEAEPGEVRTILALGDSLTAGYGVDESVNYPTKLTNLLLEDGYNYEIINAGVSGDTSADLLSRANLYLDQDPDIVLLVIGGNDGLQGKSVEDMKENIIEIIDLFDNGERKIVLGGMQIPINLGLSYSREFNAAYKDISKERKDVYFLKEFLDGVAGYARYNISDRIHPNADGYDIIVGNMFEFLKKEKIINK